MNPPHRLSRRQFVGRLSLAAAAAALPRGLRGAETSPAGKKLGVALLGLGSYAEGQLATALKVTQACRLTAAISGTPEKLEAWKTKFDLPASHLYHYGDFERIADNPDVDIIYVVTPPGTHRDFVLRAAKAGKHVICEKPMAPTVRECNEMIAACRDAGKKFSIGYRLEFEPHHIEMERVAREFGAAKMTGGFGFHMRDGRPWRVQKALAGGGSLWDVGIYVIQAACRAAGDKLPIAVMAQNGPVTRPEMFDEVEESIRWTMEFADGAICEGWSSYDKSGNEFRAESKDGSNWVEVKPAYTYGGLSGRTNHGEMGLRNINQQAAQMDDFVRCVMENRDTPVPGELGRDHVAIMQAIDRSAANGGRRVEVTV